MSDASDKSPKNFSWILKEIFVEVPRNHIFMHLIKYLLFFIFTRHNFHLDFFLYFFRTVFFTSAHTVPLGTCSQSFSCIWGEGGGAHLPRPLTPYTRTVYYLWAPLTPNLESSSLLFPFNSSLFHIIFAFFVLFCPPVFFFNLSTLFSSVTLPFFLSYSMPSFFFFTMLLLIFFLCSVPFFYF
jgi:hypothetical protein